MPTEYCFPIPIYYSMIDNVEEVQKELFSIVENITFHKSIQSNWDENMATFSGRFNENFLEKHNPKLFLKELEKHILLFFQELQFCPVISNVDIIIKESWLSKTQKNQYHHRHLHACTEMSGVYYVKAKGDEGSIGFHMPSKILLASRIFYNQSRSILHRPEVGKLLLWPSLLEHDVNSNQTENDRISLSFNISLRDKGTISHETGDNDDAE